ncbi:hypothetical protein PAPHI01_0040 [Pancytospora philotis]|nr:hypothetical protein PAPHI01_0040 [Pancytospora philotis]
MDELEQKKDRIEHRLQRLKDLESDCEFRLAHNVDETKRLTEEYNRRVAALESTRAAYAAQLRRLEDLKGAVAAYQADQRARLAREYAAELDACVARLNAVDFSFKLGVFRKFDELGGIDTAKFPHLNRKKKRLLSARRHELQERILEKVQQAMADKETIEDLIFYLNFLVKYELYFQEPVFPGFLFQIIKRKFEYHFQSSRESNRLDKPEWIYEFLLQKYAELRGIFDIYKGCAGRLGAPAAEYAELIRDTQNLLHIKVVELSESSSAQKYQLAKHFSAEHIRFNSALKSEYGVVLELASLKRVLSETHQAHIEAEMARIGELSYLQWFKEYKALCSESMGYIASFGSMDRAFRLEKLVRLIAIHTKAFIDNLGFSDRKEIQIACFFHAELADLKAHILQAEEELLFSAHKGVADDMTPKSISQLNLLAGSILKLIRSLAVGEATAAMRRVSYFNYASAEAKRNAVVDVYNLAATFGKCSEYKRIEPSIVGCIDSFVLNEIILKTRLSSNEYLEFRKFYKSIKAHFSSEIAWEADAGCEALDSLFDCKTLDSPIYRELEALYKY